MGVGARAAAPGPGFRANTDHGIQFQDEYVQGPEVGDLLGADVQCTGNPFGFYHMDGSANEEGEGSVAEARPISPVAEGGGFTTVDGNPKLGFGGSVDNGSRKGPRHDRQSARTVPCMGFTAFVNDAPMPRSRPRKCRKST